jgi:proline-rich tail region repeat protein
MRSPLPHLALAAALSLTLACNKKSEAAIQADEAAKAAEAKVAQLEQQLADAKSGKPVEGEADTIQHLTKSQVKALERQVADAKKRAEAKKQEALSLAQAPSAPEPPKSVVVEVPAGTKLEVTLSRELSTEKDQPGDAWDGILAADVVQDGRLVWSAGSPARGVVTQSAAAGRLSGGQGALGIRLTEIAGVGIDTDTHVVVATAKGERNAKYIGGGAALGALIGILSDKKNKNDHALGGAALGAAAGTALAAGTADTVIRIPGGKPVAFSLTTPERVTLRK